MSHPITAAQKVQNITINLQRAMVRKVELLDELEAVNKQINGMREGLTGVQLGQAVEQEMTLERLKREESDRQAHAQASQPK